METSEPCNCIHFANNCVIYGTGKFYSLDLKQFTVKGKEFYDYYLLLVNIMVWVLIIYIAKLLDFDRLRAVLCFVESHCKKELI